MDNLKHFIKHDEKALNNNINSNPVAVDHRKTEDHAQERDEIESFENNFNALRKEFNKFLSDKM